MFFLYNDVTIFKNGFLNCVTMNKCSVIKDFFYRNLQKMLYYNFFFHANPDYKILILIIKLICWIDYKQKFNIKLMKYKLKPSSPRCS